MARRDDDPDPPVHPRLSRRMFLGLGGTTLAALVIPGCRGGDAVRAAGRVLDVDELPPVSDWIALQRAEDLVDLRLGLVNLTTNDARTELVRTGWPALIVVGFPAQHVLERTPLDSNPSSPAPAPPLPIETDLSHESRIVFVVPDELDTLPMHAAALLDELLGYPINVNSKATPAEGLAVPEEGEGTTSVTEGALHPLETSIELPWRLQMSPNVYARWAHSPGAVKSRRERFELWHTRLAVVGNDGGVDERRADLRTVRALHHRSFQRSPWPDAVGDGAALSEGNRETIVALSKELRPPMRVAHLMLSALGGWLDGRQDFAADADLDHWIQRTAMGRDYYVEIAARGYAYPFRHKMMLVEISERKQRFEEPAFLWKRHLLIPVERTLGYEPNGDPELDKILRRMPFSTMTFLDASIPVDNAPPDADRTFAPKLGGRDVRPLMEAYTRDGARHVLRPTILWMPDEPELDPNPYEYAKTERRTDMGGRRLWLAPHSDDATGTTSYEARALRFDGAWAPASVPRPCRFYPVVTDAELAVDALRQLLGTDDAPQFTWAPAYVADGFGGGNPRELIVQLADLTKPIRAAFTTKSDRSGGFVAPNLDVRALSRRVGPIADVASTLDVDPKTLFPKAPSTADALAEAKLFGCVSLADLLSPGAFDSVAPKFLTQAIDDATRFVRLCREVVDVGGKVEGDLAGVQDYDDVSAAVMAEIRAATGSLASSLNSLRERANTIRETVDRWLGGTVPDVDDALRWLHDNAGAELVTDLRALRQQLLDTKALPYVYARVPDLENGVRAVTSAMQFLADLAVVAEDVIGGALRGLHLARNQEITIDWTPPLQSWGPFVVRDGQTKLTLRATVRGKQRGDAPAGVDLLCNLERFDLVLVPGTPCITLHFDKLAFRSAMGKKPEIDVVFGGLEFGGPLAFIQTLKEALPLDGFSDPPGVDITPSGLRASYSLALPACAVGIFSLENVGIHAELGVPFIGDAMSLKFSFSTREKPFLLTVSGLGGTGYVGIVLTPAGIVWLEAQLEFGAHVSLNFGVASGAVSVMAGVYFGLKTQGPTEVTLQGFLRIRGEVDVLGLVSASIELRMTLEYRTRALPDRTEGKLVGRASLEIEVSLAFFSKSVRIEVERTFAGANGDPTFAQVVAPADWRAYCAAFAA